MAAAGGDLLKRSGQRPEAFWGDRAELHLAEVLKMDERPCARLS
jgi:hypothetical protein